MFLYQMGGAAAGGVGLRSKQVYYTHSPRAEAWRAMQLHRKHLGGQKGVRGEVQAGAFVEVSGEKARQSWAG